MSKVITTLLLGLLCFTSIGCGGDDEAERNRQKFKKDMDNLDDAFRETGVGPPEVPPKNSGSTSATTFSSAESQLQKIVERGRTKAPSVARDGWNFVDVHVESIKTASLTYRFAGRIMADYKKDDGGRIDRCAVYLKHDGTKWIFHKFSRGGVGPEGWPPLNAAKALAPGKPPYNSTAGAHAIFTVWLP